ncbi:MAG: YggS family pyridoxal phosphate-dependent enzyme [Thiomicrospira sp.]|uniref:YggS family pyridoxal phosphate-dependent enzyme n=1 Tax=Thiomicrospira sp. TaxID=935 RepID=UPI0019E7189F|nr:YggS family pyridoxal phosphate-dependent enzyme [Thiomicrospira sp.]MBE0493173.1 YggS family pyridoxal phosphate-dependent enzyme [Thiomicrospira sp.]
MDYQANLAQVTHRIRQAEQRFDRLQGSVQLLAVSKTKPIEAINALAKLGQNAFGENYLQESLDKIGQRPDLEWHFIGPIQSNKTKPIAEHFNWVHSVDRLKIAQRLSAQRPTELPPLNILLQVNISQEETKSGFSPQQLLDQVEQIQQLPNLTLRGLMAIPKAETEFDQQRVALAQMHSLFNQLKSVLNTTNFDTLSMGMSGDLEAAIAEGSTLVRIGTDLFGARDYAV